MSDNGVKTEISIGVRCTYAAAHTLRSPHLSDTENLQVFGKCAHPHGHGHDYRFEFIVSATELSDGVVMNRGDLRRCIAEFVSPYFDGTNLNDVFGGDVITSGEILARAAWELLAPHLPDGVVLRVRLEETRKNSFIYPSYIGSELWSKKRQYESC